jgi:hypothetical protein
MNFHSWREQPSVQQLESDSRKRRSPESPFHRRDDGSLAGSLTAYTPNFSEPLVRGLAWCLRSGSRRTARRCTRSWPRGPLRDARQVRCGVPFMGSGRRAGCRLAIQPAPIPWPVTWDIGEYTVSNMRVQDFSGQTESSRPYAVTLGPTWVAFAAGGHDPARR